MHAVDSSLSPPEGELINPIAQWAVGDSKVCLFVKQNRLFFSETKEGAHKEGEIPLNLYDLPYAVNLVHLFHQVIQENLVNGAHPACFLPILCTDAFLVKSDQTKATDLAASKVVFDALQRTGFSGAHLQVFCEGNQPAYARKREFKRNLRVALFAKVDKIAGRVIHARWGIANLSNHTSYGIPLDPRDRMVNDFLINAPSYNKPNPNKAYNYAMTHYSKGFRVGAIYDPELTIHSVSMSHASLFNREVLIDENQWAITLVSKNAICRVGLLTKDTGHAMIAYEGVERDSHGVLRPFIKYAHITTEDADPDHPDPSRQKNEARVERFSREPYALVNASTGPTWSVPKDAIRNMEQIIDNGPRYVPFSFFGEEIKVDRLSSWTKLAMKLTGRSHELSQLAKGEILTPRSCIAWCKEILRGAGVTIDSVLLSPHDTVKWLKEEDAKRLLTVSADEL